MKRMMTMALVAIIAAATVVAQEDRVAKPRLLVENFTTANGLPTSVCDQMRMNVISAFIKTDRFEIMDVNTQAALDDESGRRSKEGAMYDDVARTENIVLKANNYILRGSLLSCSTQSTIVDGKTRYNYGVSYSITLVDAAKSLDVATMTYTHGSLGAQSVIGGTEGKILNHLSTYSSEADAIKAGLSFIEKEVKKFLVEKFPLEGEVIAEDCEVKKDKLVACYINLGSDLGAKVGDQFSIKMAQSRAGKTIYQEIGQLKVKEVLDGTLSYCTVTKGAKAIFEAMEEYRNLVLEDPNTLPLLVEQID